MDFRTFDPGKDDYIYDHYIELLKRPQNTDKFKAVVERGLKDAEQVLGFDSDVEVVLGEADPDKIDERFNAENINFHVHGFTFGSWFDDWDRDFIFVYVNDSVQDWKVALRDLIVHERAHIDFYDFHSDEELKELLRDSMYYNLLFEGHSTNCSETVARTKNRDWRPPQRRPQDPNIDFDMLMEELSRERENSDLLDTGGDLSASEGYYLAFRIFRYIMEENNLNVTELPGLSPSENRRLINNAIKELYKA